MPPPGDPPAIERSGDLWPGGVVAAQVLAVGVGHRSTGGIDHQDAPSAEAGQRLLVAFHAADLEIAIETNGTLPVPDGIDWICVSPKMGASLVVTRGNELKVVIPQAEQQLQDYAALAFDYFYLQPMDGPALVSNTQLAIATCKEQPQWRLSLQTHKLLQIP